MMHLDKALILASTSKYRKALLERLRLPFTCLRPDFEEDPDPSCDHQAEALRLAEGKARSVQTHVERGLIIGSDQLVSFNGEILGKPHTEAGAVKQLMRLQGASHELITALCVLDAEQNRLEHDVSIHRMTLRSLNEEQIARYVRADQPLDCAGSYKLEKLGVSLFESVVGEDDTAIIGLPLMKLVQLLGRFGVCIP